MPSARLSAVAVATGVPAFQESDADGALAACTPTTRVDGEAWRVQVPMPLISAPAPTGT